MSIKTIEFEAIESNDLIEWYKWTTMLFGAIKRGDLPTPPKPLDEFLQLCHDHAHARIPDQAEDIQDAAFAFDELLNAMYQVGEEQTGRITLRDVTQVPYAREIIDLHSKAHCSFDVEDGKVNICTVPQNVAPLRRALMLSPVNLLRNWDDCRISFTGYDTWVEVSDLLNNHGVTHDFVDTHGFWEGDDKGMVDYFFFDIPVDDVDYVRETIKGYSTNQLPE